MRNILILSLFFIVNNAYSQAAFERSDSLRGSLSQFRSFDVKYYDLNIKVDPGQKKISGHNSIFFTLSEPLEKLQLDLYQNMIIDSIIWEDEKIKFTREFNAVWLYFDKELPEGNHAIQVYYYGQPVEAETPPWDGGFVWKTDSMGQPWVAVACEGAGASLWWPNKDHLSDEPDSMHITATVPEALMCVANGTLVKVRSEDDGWKTFRWQVSYPINNYNVTLNIADYALINDTYITADNDTLPLSYYVLPFNKEKAKQHFRQVKDMLSCFENYFGPYPFLNDGYKLVETPYWGMEHQSAIAYGNQYVNNEFGFDFIIVHESGHEYWGNSISTWDHGQLWIHESFTTYMEALLVECKDGYQKAQAYLGTQKPLIKNKVAIEQPVGVNYNQWPDADMYYKGTWMLHTIRNIIDNDDKWFSILKQLYNTYKISVVNSDSIVNFIDKNTDEDLQPVFDQYLHRTNPPILQYYWEKDNEDWRLFYRWHQVVEDFKMPVKFKIGDQVHRIIPTHDWQNGKLKLKENFVWSTDLYYFIPENIPSENVEDTN